MDRNTLLAFALSMIVFTTYLMYQESRREELAVLAGAESTVASGSEAGATAGGVSGEAALGTSSSAEPSAAGDRVATADRLAAGAAEAAAAARPQREIPLETITLSNDVVVAQVSNGPGLIEGWTLRSYAERLPNGDVPIELVDSQLPVLSTELRGVAGSGFADARFEVIRKTNREVVQRAQNEAGVLTRTIRLDESGYGFDLELVFESHRVDPADIRFEILWPEVSNTRPDFAQLSLLAYGENEGVTRSLVQSVGQPGFLGFGGSSDGTERVEGRAQWAGFDIQYFVGVIVDPQGRERFDVQFEALEPKTSAFARVTLPSVSIGSGGTAREELRGFFGPKTQAALSEAGHGLEHSIDRGWSWLEPLTRFFEIALDWLYAVIPNYGFAIIVLTILVRIATAPLTVKQMRSAERMREVKPKMDALQAKYKDDRQKQSEELMKLYRTEGINPLSGCFPILLQMPVLIGLFYALRTSISLRHASFGLWITDLSQPATLFVLPGLDFPVRVLPVIMGVSMFVQQKMMPQAGMDPTQARMMLFMMPAMMLFISYTFPSGLVLYWTVSNLLGIAHQYWIRNHLQPSKS